MGGNTSALLVGCGVSILGHLKLLPEADSGLGCWLIHTTWLGDFSLRIPPFAQEGWKDRKEDKAQNTSCLLRMGN